MPNEDAIFFACPQMSGIAPVPHVMKMGKCTTTTGGSKIFLRERFPHVRCYQNVTNVVQPSSRIWQVFRSGENVSKHLNFYMLIIMYFHLFL